MIRHDASGGFTESRDDIVQNAKFGGKSIIVDLVEDDGVILPKTKITVGEGIRLESFDLSKYDQSRKTRYSDHKKFS